MKSDNQTGDAAKLPILGEILKWPTGASEGAPPEPPGPAKVVAAVPTGSPAGSGRPQPKPLICRLADLMKEWRQTRDNMKARGEDDAAIAVECCMETLHEDVTNFMKEMKDYREHCAKQGNVPDQPRP